MLNPLGYRRERRLHPWKGTWREGRTTENPKHMARKRSACRERLLPDGGPTWAARRCVRARPRGTRPASESALRLRFSGATRGKIRAAALMAERRPMWNTPTTTRGSDYTRSLQRGRVFGKSCALSLRPKRSSRGVASNGESPEIFALTYGFVLVLPWNFDTSNSMTMRYLDIRPKTSPEVSISLVGENVRRQTARLLSAAAFG